MTVLLYVQHLLGIGHVRRAALLADALAARGMPVTVAYGGFPVPGVGFGAARTVRLPPARAADAAFSAVVGEDGAPVGEAWKAARRDRLLALYDEVRPDILITETFPFGRRMFRFELEPLLDRARSGAIGCRPLIASSVRDVLVVKRDPAKQAWMADAARRWFDLVLVHGDPALVPFEASFPPARRIADLIRHTGYVAPPRDADQTDSQDGRGEVVVSVGGGAVGGGLLRAAAQAKALCNHAGGVRWRLLAGPDLPDGDLAAVRRAAAGDPGIVVEPARPDFPALLRRCRLSISQAGYNTVMDVLAAGCRAVLVPFAQGAETEQADRAALLAARGLVEAVPEAGLTPQSLAEAAGRALAFPSPPRAAVAMDGAARSAELLQSAFARIAAPRGATGLPRHRRKAL
jgi:predicted glycosyltransferase